MWTVMLVSLLRQRLSRLPVDFAPVFCTGRAIIGLGLASFLMTSLIVVQEIAHPRNRETVAASWVSST